MIRYEIRRENFVSQAAYDAAIRNFANWYTYYHKRHMAARGAIGIAFKEIEGFRVGTYRINNRPNPATDLPIRDLSISADRSAFFKQAYEDLSDGGTPSREAVNSMRAQFKRTDADAPIQEACQMNFGVLLTDGYANNWTGAGVGNRDGNFPAPFKDSVSNTMADIAMELYVTNPRPELPTGLVPVPVACHLSDPDPWIDCNSNLHVNLFALSLGTTGTIFNIDPAVTADPFVHSPTWPTSFSDRNPVHVDDLWHAAINSRGGLADVSVPADLGQRFIDVLAEIAARLETSATAAAASSAVLQSDTQLFVAGFRSTDWSGELKSYALVDKGKRGAVRWDAESRLAKTDRKLFTSSNGDGVALDWLNLSAAQRDALDRAPDGSVDGAGEQRVAWLRGTESGGLRSRSATGTKRLLGDIVYSNPQFVGRTDYGYNLLAGEEGAAYRAYRASDAYRKRSNVLYVGANDGALHAFDAATGVELFGYMPSELLLPASDEEPARINLLMDRNYAHRFFVDGTPTIGDAYIGGAWKTILVGSMGAGGRSVFALDVTAPGAFTSSAVLWEFSDEDLGENVGQPEIVRLRNGDWAAVFGNGYNSQSHRAILFVVRLSDGALLAKIDTEEGSEASPNGLASPRVTDLPAGDLSASFVYAGDLHGNLWRFDVSDEDASGWSGPDLIFRTGESARRTGKPDKDDKDKDDKDKDEEDVLGQPITARPNLAAHPTATDTIIVLFGTGSYFRVDDAVAQDPQVQSIYGLIEDLGKNPGKDTLTRDALLQQSITWESEEVLGDASVSVREVSDLDLDGEDGWYLDLVPPGGAPVGERVVSTPTFPSGVKQERVRFTTLIPDPDPCGTARGGFVIDIDLLSGGRTGRSVFDLNDDGRFNEDDLVDDKIINGIGGSQGEELTVVRSPDGGIDYLYGGRDRIIASENAAGAIGRQSWRQLR
jgi:type IV pilus assembly protein PilY1